MEQSTMTAKMPGKAIAGKSAGNNKTAGNKMLGKTGNTVRLLLEDVAEGIRVLQTRDGIALSDDQIAERARNIVAGLIGNYRIQSLDATEKREPPRGARTVDQLNLLDQVERRAEARNNGRSGRA
jgi:hypothetical protein